MRMNANETDCLNSLVKDVCLYAIEHGCTVAEAIGDYDQPLSVQFRAMAEEAALYILGSLEAQLFNSRL